MTSSPKALKICISLDSDKFNEEYVLSTADVSGYREFEKNS